MSRSPQPTALGNALATESSALDELRTLRALREREREVAESAEDRVGGLAVAVLFVGALLWVVGAFGGPGPPGRWIGAATATLVLLLVVWRRRLTRQRVRRTWSVEWLARALARIGDAWDFGQDGGLRFADAEHPFTADLSVFGSFSLFERLNSCHTPLGERALAGILDASAVPGDGMVQRQAAVRELARSLAVRERYELAFREFESRSSVDAGQLEQKTRGLMAWGRSGPESEAHPIPVPVHVALAAAALTGASATLLFAAPWWVGALPYVLNLVILRRARWLGDLDRRFDAVRRTLEPWGGVLATMEADAPSDPLLARIRSPVAGSGAARAVEDLGRHARSLAQRRNLIWVLTGEALLLWDFVAARRLEAWRRQHGPDLHTWLEAAALQEAMVSLATYAAAVPDHTWPREVWEGAPLVAEGLAHPLLAAEQRVANDVELDPVGAITVVTGSNMSGKSTYLRAVGLGVVMAQTGIPVPAASMTLRPLPVVTSMVVTESLERGSSRFHAEVTRIRRCLEWAEQAGGGLVLLDEILSGTNSRERHIGTMAVLRQLGRIGAVTLVSTHDLSLAALEIHLPHTRTVHFRDQVVNGHMSFDYRLRPGVLPSTNALEIMRAEGIEVDDLPTDPTPHRP